MNILITGIHGFVGSNLVQALRKEHTIYGLDIVAPEKEGVQQTLKWEDLNNAETMPAIDAIIHLAGKAHDTKNQSAAQVYFDVNTGLTQKLFDYFVASAAKKFIFFSSVKAAADFVPGDVLTEEVVPAPVGPYGESKIKAEEYIQREILRFAQNGIGGTRNDIVEGLDDIGENRSDEEEKQVYILRPCMIHGPGNKGNLNLLYNVVKKGIPWPLGDFENRRSFVSIDNLCAVIDGLIGKEMESGIYHIADDEAMSTNELIATICEAMGKRSNIWKLNRKLMEGVAKMGTTLRLPLNEDRLCKLTENYVVSNAKIKKALDIEKMPVTAKEGMLKTIRSFEENK